MTEGNNGHLCKKNPLPVANTLKFLFRTLWSLGRGCSSRILGNELILKVELLLEHWSSICISHDFIGFFSTYYSERNFLVCFITCMLLKYSVKQFYVVFVNDRILHNCSYSECQTNECVK